jgi:hypothetical protein
MPPSPSTIAAWLGSGRLALRDAAASLRLWAAFQSSRATPPQRRRTVLRVIASTTAKVTDLARALAARLAPGLYSIPGWHRDTLDVLAAGHMAGMMAATGTADPAPADVDEAAAEVDRQAGYLGRFAGDLAAGLAPLWAAPAEARQATQATQANAPGILSQVGSGLANLSRVANIGAGLSNLVAATKAGVRQASGRFLARVGMYADAIWGTAEKVVAAKMVRDGYTHERWVLGDGTSRHCPDCPRLAAMGWVPAGVLPAVGTQRCMSKCRCSKSWSHGEALSPTASPMAAVA